MLERFQRKAGKIILGIPLSSPSNHTYILTELGWPTLSSRRQMKLLLLAFKLYTRTAPSHLLAVCPPRYTAVIPLRHCRVFALPQTRTNTHLNSPIIQACHLFNCLPPHLREARSYREFHAKASSLTLSTTCNCSNHICTP